MPVPGVDRSEALTRAAQKLSAARADLAVESEVFRPNPSVIARLTDRVESAELASRAAFKAYTNPFGVEKNAP